MKLYWSNLGVGIVRVPMVDSNEERMADFCIATVQGAMLMGKIKRNSETAETTAREALAHLKGYVVTPKH